MSKVVRREYFVWLGKKRKMAAACNVSCVILSGAKNLAASAPKLIQLPAFSKYVTVNALTTEHAESTEEDLGHLLLLVFSVASVCSVVNAMEDGNGISFSAGG